MWAWLSRICFIRWLGHRAKQRAAKVSGDFSSQSVKESTMAGTAEFDFTTAVVAVNVLPTHIRVRVTGPTAVPEQLVPNGTPSVKYDGLSGGDYTYEVVDVDPAGNPVANADGSPIAPKTGSFSVPTQLMGAVVTAVTVKLS